MGKRILKIAALGLLVGIGGYAVWQGGNTLVFYFAPSESTLAETGFD